MGNYNFLDRKYFFLISMLVIVIMSSVVILVFYANHREQLLKERLLKNNYSQILHLTQKQINKILNQLNTSISDSGVRIMIDNHTIDACYNNRCYRYNLLEFAELLENAIPEFIHFKVKLNENTMHFRVQKNNYDFKKMYSLNSKNKLFISVAIDKKFWENEQSVIRRPYWILFLMLLFNLTTIYWIFKFLLKVQIARHDKKVEKGTEALMKNIWDLQHQKKEEAKLHYLFACKANKLASDKHKNSKNLDLLPCAIVLQQENTGQEAVELSKMINIFHNIFALYSGNLTINKSSEYINFESKEFFYQILYSILSYLFFILPNIHIKIHIGNKNNQLTIVFTASKTNIASEKELCKYSHKFFRHHANMFILDLSQIFYILRNKNFECDVTGDGQRLVLSFIKNVHSKEKSHSSNNVIPMKLVTKK